MLDGKNNTTKEPCLSKHLRLLKRVLMYEAFVCAGVWGISRGGLPRFCCFFFLSSLTYNMYKIYTGCSYKCYRNKISKIVQ